MKKILLTTVFCCTIFAVFSQSVSDTIEIKKAFLGTVFRQNGENLKLKNLLAITKSNPDAYGYMKKARNKNTVGSVFAGVGGFLIGYTIGTAIAGKDPQWAIAGAGAGLVGAGLLFSVDAGKNARKAVQTYNQGLQNNNAGTMKIEAGFAGNGLGVRLAF